MGAMINREKIDEHARYVHEERGGGVRKALAAAATAIILLAGNLGYHKISSAGYQQVQHQAKFSHLHAPRILYGSVR